MGSIIVKIVKSGTTEDEWHYTYYTRDASGQIMAVDEKTYIDPEDVSAPGGPGVEWLPEGYWLDTTHLTPALPIPYFAPPSDGTYFHTLTRGEKRYELSNHTSTRLSTGLGNVLSTVSDRKLPLTDDEETVSGYTADVWGMNDYAQRHPFRDYAFGMLMPGRNQRRGGYRFGFNLSALEDGKEQDDEVSGQGNPYDYGFRVYNPRLGKFLSVDPLSPEYPWYTPYQFAGNKPIRFIDVDGLEEFDLMVKDRLNQGAFLKLVNPEGSLKVNWYQNGQFKITTPDFISPNGYDGLQRFWERSEFIYDEDANRWQIIDDGLGVSSDYSMNESLFLCKCYDMAAWGEQSGDNLAPILPINPIIQTLRDQKNFQTPGWFMNSGELVSNLPGFDYQEALDDLANDINSLIANGKQIASVVISLSTEVDVTQGAIPSNIQNLYNHTVKPRAYKETVQALLSRGVPELVRIQQGNNPFFCGGDISDDKRDFPVVQWDINYINPDSHED
ncbi:MAG: RHS repeat-associated core domain-containing protein [Bacteroidia bacterium]|nr:RHS repeat-associated core domain-containing protein [Bacteroidia bacterium]